MVNILLIGFGPHSKRIYFPIINDRLKDRASIKGIVEINDIGLDNLDTDIEILKVRPFTDRQKMSPELEESLNDLVRRLDISSVIIATEPLSHLQYCLWAAKNKLHVLVDKPLTTVQDIATNPSSAKLLNEDFEVLSRTRSDDKALMIASQRRYHSGYDLVRELVDEIARDYKIPITTLQATHADGQWRMPEEMLLQKYHPYMGYGKVSHSGYHLIDTASSLISSSFFEADIKGYEIDATTSFIRPSGIIEIFKEEVLEGIFSGYQKSLTIKHDNLRKLYRENKEAEVDCSSIITYKLSGIPILNFSLNLIHNSFSMRDWLKPGADLYKGNGRVKHEYMNIIQGPLQNIQVHSYQSNDKHDDASVGKTSVGGDNHFDIYVFRNSRILGGESFKLIQVEPDTAKMSNESAKVKMISEFIDVCEGRISPLNSLSDITKHSDGINIMAQIYEKGAKS